MKLVTKLFLSMIGMLLLFTGLINGQYQMEELGRGVVAVKMANNGVYVGWRMLASDPEAISFNVYRGSTKINDSPISNSTNFIDSQGTENDTYHVVPVLGGAEQGASETVMPWSQNYLSIPLQIPAGGTTPDGVTYTYNANDCSVADLDGDGEYEIVLKWDPSNAKDNANDGYTGNVYLDGLEMDGTRLWRIDLGINIRAGAHYTQFMVYDLDGDGTAELACKTAPGTKDATGDYLRLGPAAGADHTADYRNPAGRVLAGPEYFTIFNGETGVELATTDYDPPRGNLASWGDTYGNRVDRFLACIAYLDGEKPSVVMCRGYYTGSGRGRTVLAAWDYRNDALTHRWTFSADRTGAYSNYTGQGNHNLSVGDVDQDGKDEIVYGSCAIDDDGTGLWTSGLGHGDAMHLSDIDPNRPGLEVWGIHENAAVGSALLDAQTGEVIWGTGPADVGRGVSANLVDTYDGMECWGGTGGLRSCTGIDIGNGPASTNHTIWWDGDLARELLDGIGITKYNGPTLLLASGCSSNNGSKSNPSLQADLFGDWREEVIFRTSNNSALRVYTTTDTTSYRLVTLMHDRVYREGIAWQNVAYNQPPHTSYFIGAGMFLPDSLRPPSAPLNLVAYAMSDSVKLQWRANVEPDFAGYNVYRSRQQDGPFSKLNSGLLVNTSYTDTDVTNDTTYFYALTAVDTDNNESVFSEIVKAIPTVRPDSPTGVSVRNDLHAIKLLWETPGATNISGYNIYRSQTSGGPYTLLNSALVTETSYVDSPLAENMTYYYTITSLDDKLTESFYSEEISSTPGPSFTMQAEDGVVGGTVYLESNHIGYHGSGFVNFAASNSSIEFTDLPGFGRGEYTLVYRYALGNTNRTGALVVNGVRRNLTMQGTGAWTNYVLDSTLVALNDGFTNTIRFESTGSDFGNLDEITIYPRNVTAVKLVQGRDSGIPASYQLQQNYPNPFNPETSISFGLPEAGRVRIEIYDIRGRLVTTLTDKDYQAGSYEVRFHAQDVASGVYFVRSQMVSLKSQTDSHVFTRKIMLLK